MFVNVASLFIGTLIWLQNVNGQSRTSGIFGGETAAPSKGFPVIRPKPLVKPTNTFPLLGNFAKGPCFRRRAAIKPGVVPRPVYPQSHVQFTNNCNPYAGQCSTCGCCNNANLKQPCTNSGCDVIDASRAYEHACTFIKAAPLADPVSLALAYKQCQNKYAQRIAEDKLNRGFTIIPVDKEKPKPDECKKTLPELNLYQMNGQPVELKASNSEHVSCDTLSEEAEEALLNLAISEEACEIPTAKRPSLAELGYAPAQIGSTSFVNIPPTSVCNDDGFRAGTVVYKNVGNIEPIVNMPGDTLCESKDSCITIPTSTSSSNNTGNTTVLLNTHHTVLKSSSCKRQKNTN